MSRFYSAGFGDVLQMQAGTGELLTGSMICAGVALLVLVGTRILTNMGMNPKMMQD